MTPTMVYQKSAKHTNRVSNVCSATYHYIPRGPYGICIWYFSHFLVISFINNRRLRITELKMTCQRHPKGSQFYIANLFCSFSRQLLWFNTNFLRFLSLIISIPNIFLVCPRSFIPNSAFNLLWTSQFDLCPCRPTI